MSGNVKPAPDCHDLSLGYMDSGLVSSIISEKIIISVDDSLYSLKRKAKIFPKRLKKALNEEYLLNGKNLLNGKLKKAAIRNDIILYETMSSKVIRDLMIVAFSISNTHFPGDKWNEILLKRTSWKNANLFLDLIKTHIRSDHSRSLVERREYLVKAFSLVEEAFII